MRVLIGEGQVFHSRSNLMKSQFSYPSFFILFDIEAEADLKRILRKRFWGLLSFKASDYLRGERGNASTVLRQFLREKLDYEAEEVWLQSMPRMLGYVFNPVSFWILKKAGSLDAVLVEVNNTFGERHFYWIRREANESSEDFEKRWHSRAKVFHVSPFQPVDGYYDFRFRFSKKTSHVDIVHRAPDSTLRLATWLKADLHDLESRSVWSLFRKYGWMTIFVPVRIHMQAFKLWRNKMPFYSKPALPKEELT